MIELLLEAFPKHYKSTKRFTESQIHHTTLNLDSFELNDINAVGICNESEGSIVFSNKENRNITIINFEKYLNLFKSDTKVGSGKRCDFIIYDILEPYQNFILTELTRSKEDFLGEHLRDGTKQPGKRAYAVIQLSDSIAKLEAVSEIAQFLELFQSRTGLFAFRLSEENKDNNPVTEMNNAFNRFCEIVPALKTEGMLPYGFEFQQRKYPQPFDL